MTTTTQPKIPTKAIILERLFEAKHISFQELLLLLSDGTWPYSAYKPPNSFGIVYTNAGGHGAVTNQSPENITLTNGK